LAKAATSTAKAGARFKLRARREAPSETAIQTGVVKHLRAYMPRGVFWTASLSGVRLSMNVAGMAKRAGMNRGAPDLSFIWPDGQTTYIEMKAADGSLSVEQRALKLMLGDRMRVARSWDEVKSILTGWIASHGLAFLTDAEALQREADRRQADSAPQPGAST
jgi:hypothetical protein